MTLSVELTAAQLEQLRELAAQLGLPPERLASAMVAEQLSRPTDEFERASARVLDKNAELYRRLA